MRLRNGPNKPKQIDAGKFTLAGRIRRELAERHFMGSAARERVASEQVLELFAETMAMSLEGPDLARFMEIRSRADVQSLRLTQS